MTVWGRRRGGLLDGADCGGHPNRAQVRNGSVTRWGGAAVLLAGVRLELREEGSEFVRFEK